MGEYIHYWCHCVRIGWDWGYGTFEWIEAWAVFVAAVFICHKSLRKHRETLEDIAMKAAIYLFAVSFLISTVCIAPFIQDRESAKKLSEQTAETRKFQKQIADKSQKLEGFVHRIVPLDEAYSTNSTLFLDVSVSNLGETPSDAEEFGLKVVISTNASVTGEEIKFTNEYTSNFVHKDQQWLLDLKRPQLIAEKTVSPIQNGDHRRGWLAYRLHGLKTGQYEMTNIIFSFVDNHGNRIAVTNGFWQGRKTFFTNSDDIAMVIPGAENIFYPVEPPRHNQLHDWIPPELPQGCSNVTVFFGTQPFNYTRQMAEILAATNGVKFEIKDLPSDFLKNLDAMPNYTPRMKNIWLRSGNENTTVGGKTFNYPILPVVISNRLYIEVQIPFSNDKKTLVMNDSFDPNLPIPRLWDRNYSTNYDEYGNGFYYYEVVNELTNPVLQVAYAAPNVVFVNGIFKVDSDSIYAAFGQPPALLTFSNYVEYGLQTTQRITTISLQSQTFKEIIGFRTNDSLAEACEIWTNEFYRPIFQNQRHVFKYPSYLNLGVLDDRDSTDKSVTNTIGTIK